MTRRALLPICLAVLFLAVTRPARAQEPLPEADIRNLKTSVEADGVHVSYRVDGAFTPEVRERLVSSAPVRIVHRVRLVHRRVFSTKVLAERVVIATAQFDNLTRQFTLTRQVDAGEAVTTTTESEEEMRRFLTTVSDVLLPRSSTWSNFRKATVQVRAEYEDTWLLFLLPWTYAARQERDVTIAP